MRQDIKDQDTQAKRKERMFQEDLALSVKMRKHQRWINDFFVKKFFMDKEKMGIIVGCNKIWNDLYLDWFPKQQRKEKVKWL